MLSEKQKEAFKALFKIHEVISFDLFDTLVERPFAHPTDLFEYISPEVEKISGCIGLYFKEIRISAEKAARNRSSHKQDVSLNDIYREVQFLMDCSDVVSSQIKQHELSVELKLLRPRYIGKALFSLAEGLGKNMIIISDTYFDESFIVEVLRRAGYSKYSHLFISSELNLKKQDGTVYPFVNKQLGVSSENILHVGDNQIADIQQAQHHGWHTLFIDQTLNHFKHTRYYRNIWQRDHRVQGFDTGALLSIFSKKVAANPFSEVSAEKTFFDTPYMVGYLGMGPLLLGMTKWVLEDSIISDVENLYFLARDGKILKSAYELLAPYYEKSPRAHYLLCSRRAANTARIESVPEMHSMLRMPFSNMPLKALLESRFGIDASSYGSELQRLNIDAETLVSRDTHEYFLLELLASIAEPILRNAKEERDAYLKYLTTLGLPNNGKNSVVDIGYSGSMQRALSKITRSALGGYYLITLRDAYKKNGPHALSMKGYLSNFEEKVDSEHPFLRHIPLYETVFSSEETSLIKFKANDKGKIFPNFLPEDSNEESRVKLVSEVQKGALDFTRDFIDVFKNDISLIDLSPNKSMRALHYFFTSKDESQHIFKNIYFEDSYGGAYFPSVGQWCG